MKLIFELIFLAFLSIVLYSVFAKSNENQKITEINTRSITKDEFELLKHFYKKRIIYLVIEIILFAILFSVIMYLIIKDWNFDSIHSLFTGKILDIDIILELLMLVIFAAILCCVINLNYKIYIAIKEKEGIQIIEGFCIQTKSIVKKKNRRHVKYAVELTDSEDYSKIILNLRPEQERFIIEKTINPNDRIFVFSINNEAYIMTKNTLFFKTDLYQKQLYRQKVAKEKSKNITLNIP